MPASAGLKQAYNLRDALAAEALAMLAIEPPPDPVTRPRRAMAVASLVKAWESACERIRIARGQPLPGSRRPLPKPSQSRSPRQSGLAPQQPKPQSD